MLSIPKCMMPEPLPCDSVFGKTTVEGLFSEPIDIAGVLGDSHGALVGQMCFNEGFGKATYGTGSSVMVNIGQKPKMAPEGLVTSVGFSALDKTFYAFEGNIHCTGATIQWLQNQLELIPDAGKIEEIASSVPDNGGVYMVPGLPRTGRTVVERPSESHDMRPDAQHHKGASVPRGAGVDSLSDS